MDPVLLHADGTDCRHDGPPAATAGDPGGGPCCAAGIPVTHVRVGAQILTIAEAQAAFAELTAALGEMFAVLAGNVREMAAAFSRAMSATMNGSSH